MSSGRVAASGGGGASAEQEYWFESPDFDVVEGPVHADAGAWDQNESIDSSSLSVDRCIAALSDRGPSGTSVAGVYFGVEGSERPSSSALMGGARVRAGAVDPLWVRLDSLKLDVARLRLDVDRAIALSDSPADASLKSNLLSKPALAAELQSLESSLTSVLQRLESSRASHLIAQPPATSDVSSPSSSLNVTEKRSSSASDLTRMAALDARLAQLEKAVGGNVVRPLSGLLSEVASGGVAERLATLQGRVSLLEAEPVALIEERVRRATLTLDEFRKRQTQANSVEDPAFAALVRQTWKRVSQWEESVASLPLVVARLRQLNQLHVASSRIASTMSESEGKLRDMESLLAKTAEHHAILSASLAENMSAIQTNMRMLEEKMASLTSTTDSKKTST